MEPAITSIKDPRVRICASAELLRILKDNRTHLANIPQCLAESLKNAGLPMVKQDAEVGIHAAKEKGNINLKLLNNILDNENTVEVSHITINKTKVDANAENADTEFCDTNLFLTLSDLHWLSQLLTTLRDGGLIDVYLNDLLQSSDLDLPHNEFIERNPVLEARCKMLREQQQNREYRKMTKNVDATLQHYPEDTVAYQMKAINSQIIAVLQFIFSVAAGFVFGFLGIALIVGNLDFGLRLLLGIMFALIIALAEIYFLAKKLHEYDNTVDSADMTTQRSSPNKSEQEVGKKQHAD